MGMIFGMFFALPSIEIQALFGVIAFCISENAAVILLFFWWMRDTCNIFQHCFSHLVDDLKPKRMAHLQDDGRYRRTHPPWPDAAPYLPFGGCYGYAMSQYQFKKKSGHASSKHGGECEPITSCTITHWLAFTPFWIALLYAIIFLMTSLFPSRNADCVNADVSLPIDTAAGHTFTSWGWASDTRKLLQLQVQSRLSGTLPILHAVHELLYDSLSRISWFLGKTNCLRKVLRGRRASMGTDSMGTALPEVTFHYWVRSFHWNFAQYLPAYLEWRAHVDSTTHQCYPDSTCGSFEVKEMISWRLRRMIRRRTERIQRKLARIHSMLDPMTPLPPPEPPPIWSWDVRYNWYYTILEPTNEPIEDPLKVPSLEEEKRLEDWKWRQGVSSFVSTHNPATMMQFVSDVFKPTSASAKLEVTVDLLDQRPFLKRMYHRALVQSIKLPRAYKGSVSHGIPLIVDTGASVCITPRREDFILYRDSKVTIKDLSKTNTVAGEGVVRWKVRDKTGRVVNLDLPGYHIPNAEVRLLSPQVLLSTVGSSSKAVQTTADLILCLGNGVELRAQYCPRSNLPLLSICDHAPDTQNLWHDAFHINDDDAFVFAAEKNVLDESNVNLSAAEKELLLWHHRLSHASTSWLQPLMRTKKWLQANQSSESLHQGPFLPCREKRTGSCKLTGLRCAACLASKATTRSAGARHESHDTPSQSRLEKLSRRVDGTLRKKLKRGDLTRGDCISADHYISAVTGRLEHTFGRERQGYTCGAIFVDHATSKIFNFCQYSTTAFETVTSKNKLEQLAKQEGFDVKSYHSDNGIFAAKEFKSDCERLEQPITFSGVGTQHQNGIAERNIKTVASWARANMLHSAYHWPEHASIKLWPMAINYAVWVFNHLPRTDTGMCPDEMWSQCRTTHDDLRRAHVWGCPVYVLEPALQDGKKIPKWQPRARLGMFMGFSQVHSSLVPLVLNVSTGFISPQYHVVFDDKFSTVNSLSREDSIDDQWANIFKLDKEFYLDFEYDEDGKLITSDWPELSTEWLDPATQSTVTVLSRPVNSAPKGASSDEAVQAPGGASSSDEAIQAPGGACSASGPAKNTRSQISSDEFEHSSFAAARIWGQPPAPIANLGHSVPSEFHSGTKLTKAYVAAQPILQDTWANVKDIELEGFLTRDYWHPNLVDTADPRLLQAKTSKYNEDNPSWNMAMNGPFAENFWKACEVELDTLENEMNTWDYVKRTPGMHVLPGTWAFKIKRFPGGLIKKFKARFCVRGDRQKYGINFWETWSPVVHWSTIRTIMILAAKERLVSSQCDITAAFVTAPIPPDEVVYVEQPRGFKKDPDSVLRLNSCLYGMKQSPRYFFGYLTKKLEAQGLTPSEHDPCLFLGNGLLVITYVDDILIYGRSQEEIDNLIDKLKKDNLALRKEGTAEGYLGLDVSYDGKKTTLSQPGLTQRIIEALGLSSKFSTACSTPAETAALPRDMDGEPATESFNYKSVVGMLHYLNHTRPDCAFAIHQCARYTFEPKRSHEVAMKRIGRYLKGSMDKGLILDPSDDLAIDCYPDADFAGLWGHAHPQDPHCVRSRTGYVITLAGCPVLWSSKLQTEIALSTMESEYVALSTACKDLFPVMDLVKEIGTFFNLPIKDKARFHVRIHEDNVGALLLGQLEPRRMTPRSKHYAVKYHWFREQIEPRGITLVKIGTKEQLGDIFTKGLGRITFEYLRKKLMGW